MNKIYMIIALIAFWGVETLTAQVKFDIHVSQDAVDIRESLKVEFILNKEDDNFTAPNFDGFVIVGGPNQSISSTWIDGKHLFSKIYSYTLLAEKIGELVIAPASCIIDGKSYKTESISIQVTGKPEIIFTKDGVSIRKHYFLSSCVHQVNWEIKIHPIKDQKINTSEFCSCLADDFVTIVLNSEVKNALDNKELMPLFSKYRDSPNFKTCLLDSASWIIRED